MSRTTEFEYDEKLAVARELFWQKGYAATSLHDLVDAMQLNRSSIYNTYGNKHALFIECLRSYTQLKLAEYRHASQTGSSPLQAVENTIRNVVDTILAERRTCLAIHTVFELAFSDAEAQAVLKAQGQATVRLFADLLTQAQAAGEIPSHKDPELTAHFIVASFSGLWHSAIVFQKPGLVDKLMQHLLATIKA